MSLTDEHTLFLTMILDSFSILSLSLDISIAWGQDNDFHVTRDIETCVISMRSRKMDNRNLIEEFIDVFDSGGEDDMPLTQRIYTCFHVR